MRKLTYFLITFFCLFLIYNHFDNHKINYISIGDGLIKGMTSHYIENYGYNDYIKKYLSSEKHLANFNCHFYNKTIAGLTMDLKNNRTIRDINGEYFFKKVLRESDILVISIGMEELSDNYNKMDMKKNYLYFNKMYLDIENLIYEIKKYAQGKVLFIGYYNPTTFYDSSTDAFFYDIDIKLNRLMMNNQISYIDMYELIKENHYKDNLDTPFLNIKGYEKLSEIITFYINQ